MCELIDLIENYFLLQLEAEKQPDSETQKKLLAAAKLLADATAKMVEAARYIFFHIVYLNKILANIKNCDCNCRQCASFPHDKSKQEALCRAAEEIRYVTTDYASSTPDIKRQLFARLSVCNQLIFFYYQLLFLHL